MNGINHSSYLRTISDKSLLLLLFLIKASPLSILRSLVLTLLDFDDLSVPHEYAREEQATQNEAHPESES